MIPCFLEGGQQTHAREQMALRATSPNRATSPFRLTPFPTARFLHCFPCIDRVMPEQSSDGRLVAAVTSPRQPSVNGQLDWSLRSLLMLMLQPADLSIFATLPGHSMCIYFFYSLNKGLLSTALSIALSAVGDGNR